MSDAPEHEPPRLAEPVTGRCLCGAVTITVTAMQAEVDICHCAMCQRWGGAFYAGVKGDAAEVAGEDAVMAAVEALYDAADDDSATGGPDLVRGIYPTAVVIEEAGANDAEGAVVQR